MACDEPASEVKRHLRAAARLALRGRGWVEPNPMVGCIIVSPEGGVVGWGYHDRFGGPHAEIHALRRAGALASGATAYITLEPCNHAGKTGPCTEALIAAGVGRVVVARRDPYVEAAGGLERLRAVGIEAIVTQDCPEATAVSDAFVHRVTSGLPWITVKWAQTIDGRVATRTGESQWISGPTSRHLVHRERGRVDVILTGIGTVKRDDPMLTARGVRVRRIARRVVADPRAAMPPDAALARTARDVPTTIACLDGAEAAHERRREVLRACGIDIIALRPVNGNEISLESLARELVARYDATNVLVEAGSGLMSRLFQADLVNEAWVFIGPRVLGDNEAMSPITGGRLDRLSDALSLRLVDLRRRGDDVVLRYRRAVASREDR